LTGLAREVLQGRIGGPARQVERATTLRGSGRIATPADRTLPSYRERAGSRFLLDAQFGAVQQRFQRAARRETSLRSLCPRVALI